MTGPSSRDILIARRQRNVALVILGTFAVWLPMQWIGAWADVPTRWMALVDFAALGLLAWALIMLLRVRRMRREGE
ncbi:MAG: DUF5337 family protein [Jannaschia sp.]